MIPSALTLEELDDLPDPKPLVSGGILDAGTVAMLSGPAGKGKSFIALDWAMSIASGNAWLGNTVHQGSALYVAAEGAAGLKIRTKAWRKDKALYEMPFEIIPGVVNLNDFDHVAELSAEVHRMHARLLVIDTLAKCSLGADENSASDMGLIVNSAYMLRDAWKTNGTTVLLVHHTGYNTARARGSSALVAGIDHVWDLTSDDPYKSVAMQNSKRKDGIAHSPMSVRLEVINGSCVIREAADSKARERVQALELSEQGFSQRHIADVMNRSVGYINALLRPSEPSGGDF
ncbi:MAG: AAA family ATPase [Streptosporangiaceae bacterium]